MTSDASTGLPDRPAGGLLLEGGAVVTVDDQFTIHDPGWVHIIDDLIVGVGQAQAPTEVRRSVGRIIDTTGHVVMPGMTNAHTHLFQTFFRGLADDKPLLDWISDCIWPGAVHLDAESAHLAALVGMIENLRGGATSIIDHQYVHLAGADGNDHIDNAVAEAAEASGVRFLLARGWADRNYEPAMTETPETTLERTDRVRTRWHGAADGRIRIELAPLIPWGCTDEAMQKTIGQARQWGIGTHIHCAETAVEVEMNLEERGTRHVEWLEDLGVLGPDVQLAHSVWLDDGELDLIALRGAVVVHCPVSNMYLASGIPRIVDMLERGIDVALASDGPGSNNRQDMFEVLKATVLLQKIGRLDAMALQPEDALRMACRGGALAAGLHDHTGELRSGAKADAIVVNLESVFVAPVHRVESALVFNVMPAHLTHSIVDGRVLIDDGIVTFADEAKVLAAANSAARRVFTAAGISSRLTS